MIYPNEHPGYRKRPYFKGRVVDQFVLVNSGNEFRVGLSVRIDGILKNRYRPERGVDKCRPFERVV
jgi:hypothetical protein